MYFIREGLLDVCSRIRRVANNKIKCQKCRNRYKDLKFTTTAVFGQIQAYVCVLYYVLNLCIVKSNDFLRFNTASL